MFVYIIEKRVLITLTYTTYMQLYIFMYDQILIKHKYKYKLKPIKYLFFRNQINHILGIDSPALAPAPSATNSVVMFNTTMAIMIRYQIIFKAPDSEQNVTATAGGRSRSQSRRIYPENMINMIPEKQVFNGFEFVLVLVLVLNQ